MRKLHIIIGLVLFSLFFTACEGAGSTHLYEKENHTHVFGNRYDITPVSCVAEGEEIRYCKICHAAVTEAVAVPEDIAARKHSFSDTVVAPTESAQGYTRRACTVCEYVIERADVKPARYALLTDATTKGTAPEGVSGILVSDTASHLLSYNVGYGDAVKPIAARRLALALAVVEELQREGTAFRADTVIQLTSGPLSGNRYTVRELLFEWIATGDADVARGFAMALDGNGSAFSARIHARLEKLGVLGAVAVDPFAEGEGNATLGATAIMLARALDEPLLREAFAESVPRLQQVSGQKPLLYLSLGDLRLTALEGEGGVYQFSLLAGEALPTGVENTLFSAS